MSRGLLFASETRHLGVLTHGPTALADTAISVLFFCVRLRSWNLLLVGKQMDCNVLSTTQGHLRIIKTSGSSKKNLRIINHRQRSMHILHLFSSVKLHPFKSHIYVLNPSTISKFEIPQQARKAILPNQAMEKSVTEKTDLSSTVL